MYFDFAHSILIIFKINFHIILSEATKKYKIIKRRASRTSVPFTPLLLLFYSPFTPFLSAYSFGNTPNCFWKHLLKYEGVPKPTW